MFHKVMLFLKLAIIIIMVGAQTIFSKSFTIDRIEIEATIETDGSLFIREARTYTFRGQFSWADYRLPLQGLGEVKDFLLQDESIIYLPGSDSQPGSYYIESYPDEFYVRWFYQAQNETRNFILQYRLSDAVTLYQDVAEFYYQFVGADNQFQVGKVDITIAFPQTATYPEVRAWAHGPLWGTIQFFEGKIKLEVSPLPAQQFWEARVVFPLSWVPSGQRRMAKSQLSYILAEEEDWAVKSNMERERAKEKEESKKQKQSLAWKISLLLAGIPPIIWLLLFLKHGQSHRVPFYETMTSELPLDEPPAVTSAFLHHGQVYGHAIIATILDLARRGYLNIEQSSPPEKKWWGTKPPEFVLQLIYQQKADDQLLDFEKDLLEFIFTNLGKGETSVNFSTFRKESSTVRKWFTEWKKLVENHLQNQPYYDRESKRATVYSILTSLAILAAGILIVVYLGNAGTIAIVSGATFFWLSLAILRYTPEVKLRLKKLTALQKYLKKYSFLQESSKEMWPSFLVYGVALGVGNKVIEKMMLSLSVDEQHHYFYWYHYPVGRFASPADFASAITSMISIASSTMSSSSGAGGGASSGGGGGGGGASGGAG